MDMSEVIDLVHLLAALALWDYCDRSALHIFGDSMGDPMADEILAALKRHPGGMTRTEISDMFGRHRNAKQISKALSTLQNAGKVFVESTKTKGRPVERWMATATELA
jgi:predicted ArsR family transcriptional regulator